jgi:hypothetical protein
MGIRKWTVAIALMIVILLLGLAVGLSDRTPLARGDEAVPEGQSQEVAAAPAAADDPLILSYAAKFVCLESQPPGVVSYSKVAHLVKETTDVLIHNPNDFTVTFYKKATLAQVQSLGPATPGKWVKEELRPDEAIRVNCDEITKLLTGDAAATFVGKYGIGKRVEGFVVVGIGPSTTAAGNIKYSPLDVTAEYSRSSEVLKKDINYQPWWRYWWWPLPWQLGYPYERLIYLGDLPTTSINVDCRELLVTELKKDVADSYTSDSDPAEAATIQALDAGLKIHAATVMSSTGEASEPALVALIGRCDKGGIGPAGVFAAVDYVLVSNRGPTDDPTGGTVTQPNAVHLYPWYPGRWYDLTMVIPQNVTRDMDDYIHEWHLQTWMAASGLARTDLLPHMAYFFPYWCGWGYWWWWWHGDDCIDIGVGEGESIDVEQITPVRVIMTNWPPP